MGINHDNDHPSCADGLHIMSGEWIKGQNLGDVSWSRCSREDLERFLRYIIQEKNSYHMSFTNSCNKYLEITSFQYFLLLLWEIYVCIIHQKNLNHHKLYNI